jgi:hypothetical protein
MPGRYAAFPIDKGFFEVFSIADPGSSADLSWVPPANMICLPLCLSAIITLAAGGVASVLSLEVHVPFSTIIWTNQHSQPMAVAGPTRVSAHLGGAAAVNLALDEVTLPLPPVYLVNADRLRIVYDNKRAGDRITDFEVGALVWRDTP